MNPQKSHRIKLNSCFQLESEAPAAFGWLLRSCLVLQPSQRENAFIGIKNEYARAFPTCRCNSSYPKFRRTLPSSDYRYVLFQWATVTFHLPHQIMKLVANAIVTELKKINQNVAALSVASSILDRLSYLLSSTRPELGVGPGRSVDR